MWDPELRLEYVLQRLGGILHYQRVVLQFEGADRQVRIEDAEHLLLFGGTVPQRLEVRLCCFMKIVISEVIVA